MKVKFNKDEKILGMNNNHCFKKVPNEIEYKVTRGFNPFGISKADHIDLKTNDINIEDGNESFLVKMAHLPNRIIKEMEEQNI